MFFIASFLVSSRTETFDTENTIFFLGGPIVESVRRGWWYTLAGVDAELRKDTTTHRIFLDFSPLKLTNKPVNPNPDSPGEGNYQKDGVTKK